MPFFRWENSRIIFESLPHQKIIIIKINVTEIQCIVATTIRTKIFLQKLDLESKHLLSVDCMVSMWIWTGARATFAKEFYTTFLSPETCSHIQYTHPSRMVSWLYHLILMVFFNDTHLFTNFFTVYEGRTTLS